MLETVPELGETGERGTEMRKASNVSLRGSIIVNACGATLLALLLGGAGSAFGQDYRGTSDQQSACMSDVFRLCSSEIPNVTRIVACLKHERPRLSDGCRAVFGGASTRVAASGRRHHHRIAANHRPRHYSAQ
jgi:hypothetical protein